MSHPVIKEDKLVWYPLDINRGVRGATEEKKYLVVFQEIKKGELKTDMRVCKWWSDSIGFGLESDVKGLAYAEITAPV